MSVRPYHLTRPLPRRLRRPRTVRPQPLTVLTSFLLTQEEFDKVIETVSKVFTAEFLREMYGCNSELSRSALVTGKCESEFVKTISKRATVDAPPTKNVEQVLREVVADIEKEPLDESELETETES